tara:strand:- start:268 stop:1125 length:858 start_codon:yes stop_codon:yes gene_type:complete
MIKIIGYFLQSFFIYLFFLIVFILRLRISRKIFAFLFSLLGSFFRSQKIIFNNLEIFSKELTEVDKSIILKKMWRNYGMTFVEYMFLKHFRKSNSHVKIDGEKNLEETIQHNQPVIFVSGHFANFELMSMEITKKNIPLATIYRPLNNMFLNPFMEFLREKYVCRNQIKKGVNGVRQAIEYIKRKHSIALMIDQRVSEGVKITLFQKPAYTTTLPAQLSIKYNLKIIPVYIERNEDNNFKIEFQKAIDPKNFDDKLELSKELNTVIEKMIRKNPNQWIWTHNRWK